MLDLRVGVGIGIGIDINTSEQDHNDRVFKELIILGSRHKDMFRLRH